LNFGATCAVIVNVNVEQNLKVEESDYPNSSIKRDVYSSPGE